MTMPLPVKMLAMKLQKNCIVELTELLKSTFDASKSTYLAKLLDFLVNY